MSSIDVENALFGKSKQWQQLKPNSWLEFSRLLEKLMGTDTEQRRKYIFDNVDFDRVTFL